MIVFQKSGLSDLTIQRGRAFPVRNPHKPNQIRHLTENNQAKVISFGQALRLVELQVGGLNADNYNGAVNGLQTWFSSSQINYSLNSFTMIDEYGESNTVRLWQDDFEVVETEPGIFAIKVTLKIE